MTQRTHLDDFLRSRIIGHLLCRHTQLEVAEELGITLSVTSRRTSALSRKLSSASGATILGQTMYRRLGKIGQDARRPVRCVIFTATRCHLQLTWSREHAFCGHHYSRIARLQRNYSGFQNWLECSNWSQDRPNLWGHHSATTLDHVWDILDRQVTARQPPPREEVEPRRNFGEHCLESDVILYYIFSQDSRVGSNEVPDFFPAITLPVCNKSGDFLTFETSLVTCSIRGLSTNPPGAIIL
ncbi:transposable element Tcb2 transposase [Trichonephila clavipes]|nr:transposable element Tcb2 transposase [Trichonephila clavipes]